MLFFCETIERRKIGQREQFVTIHPKEDAISNYQNDADLLDIKAYLLENTKVQKLTLFIARFFVNSTNEIRHGSDKMMPHTYRLHNEEVNEHGTNFLIRNQANLTVQSNGNRPFGRTMFTFTEVYCCEWITFVSVVGRVSRRQICCVVVGIIVLVALIVLVVYLVQEYLKYSYHQIGKK
ncbi:hypothetical protein L5515_019534 [Caenorhabditis briggsae]|uniref:Uncharacterized protein n=1 Tax=Caenorhabditis briggsae TaxID=6238 RepID=A0AAE9FK09_CAEBR|nr:hypothetical protein L5515_019534 [Caenorhabditis briggsae]